MKKKKEDNSFQLLFTALVLVVISIGGTLAWFASSNRASVSDIGASITAPVDHDDFDGAPVSYYDFSKGQFVSDGDNFVTYVPGKNMIFRIQTTTAQNVTVQLVGSGSAPKLGEVIKIGFYDEISNSWKENGILSESLFPKPSTTFSSMVVTNANGGWTVTSGVSPKYDAGDGMYYLYFFLYMDPQAGEVPLNSTQTDYQNMTLSFKVRVSDT